MKNPSEVFCLKEILYVVEDSVGAGLFSVASTYEVGTVSPSSTNKRNFFTNFDL